MNEDQFNEMLSYMKLVALNTAVIAAQAQKKAPLSDDELEQCRTDTDRAVVMLKNGLL